MKKLSNITRTTITWLPSLNEKKRHTITTKTTKRGQNSSELTKKTCRTDAKNHKE